MRYVDFLSCLFEDGRITVPEVSPLTDEVVRTGDALIAEYERVYRTEMPSEAPRLVRPAARWAGTRFFRACQAAVYRDVSEETLKEELGEPFGEPAVPDVHYSVDLVFRYLPDFSKFASSAAEHDPLLEYLHQWAKAWPLSSVGMSGIGEVAIDGFAASASLMQLYVDRVIATCDESRLSDIRVRDVVRATLGMFGGLNERISTALEEYDSQETNE